MMFVLSILIIFVAANHKITEYDSRIRDKELSFF